MLDIRFAASAERHGISTQQSRHVVEHCGLVFDLPPPSDPFEPDRLLFAGDDARGVALEVIAVPDRNHAILVVHAMRLRRRFRRQYNEALPWRVNP